MSRGSPPHARGKVFFRLKMSDMLSITPARAGKSSDSDVFEGQKRDHPRTRGEKPVDLPYAVGQTGITPARAGKRIDHKLKPVEAQDHPRTRGEKNILISLVSTAQGSPPHARGKVLFPRLRSSSARITPARAGKSARDSPTNSAIWDHPRTRGEKRVFLSGW